jgi:hypothetical protein
MAGVMIYQRAERDFAFDPSRRGHHVVYRANETNFCPGCGRAQWHIGRMTAECGFCGTAVALADAQWSGGGIDKEEVARTISRLSSPEAAAEAIDWAERREHERLAAANRTLQLLIDGSPHAFALRNISSGGVMGDDPVGLSPGSEVQVRFEGGILVPAEVRWTEGPLTGLAFTSPVMLDLGRGN